MRGGPAWFDGLAAWLKWICFVSTPLRRGFCRSIDLAGCSAAEGRVRTSPLVVMDPVADAASGFAAGLEGAEENGLRH